MCPQGFKNSSYFLQQALLKALKGINNVLLLADDITIYSTISEEDNIRTVIKVIQRLHEEGFKISHKKVILARQTIEILGITYSLGTLSIPQARMQGYLDWQTPNSYRQIKSFLSSISYFRYHLPNFSK